MIPARSANDFGTRKPIRYRYFSLSLLLIPILLLLDLSFYVLYE